MRNFTVFDTDLGTKAIYLVTLIGIFWVYYYQ
jgi:hypothetical protein